VKISRITLIGWGPDLTGHFRSPLTRLNLFYFDQKVEAVRTITFDWWRLFPEQRWP